MELHTDKEKKMKVKRTCPLCGRSYSAPPALSRKDNATEICPMCGILEALAAAGGTWNGQEGTAEKTGCVNKEEF